MLKPVDLTVLCYLASAELRPAWTQAEVAAGLGIAQSNVHRALVQLDHSGLLVERRPRFDALRDLIVHAVRYVYPATLGAPTRGIGTAHAGPAVASKVISGEPYVWSFDGGTEYGPSLDPLHPSVPAAAARCPRFHGLMALVDVLRVGRVRERELAVLELGLRLGGPP